MTVQDVLDDYMAEDRYVGSSMINKSYNDYGCTYKWLFRKKLGVADAFRREIFISTTGTGDVPGRTVVEHVEIMEAL